MEYLQKLEYNKILEKLASYCHLEASKKEAYELKPYTEIKDIKQKLEETTEAVNLIYRCSTPPVIEFIEDKEEIKIIKTEGTLSLKSIINLTKILKISGLLKKYINQDFLDLEKYKNLKSIFDELYTNNGIIEKVENSVIDEYTLDDKASKQLQAIRKKQKNIEQDIRQKLNNMIHSSNYSKYIQESVITIRNERYVIPVKEEYRSQIKGFVHDISSSGSTVFIEPIAIFEMNNQISNLKIEENIEIERIIKELSSLFYPYSLEIEKDIQYLKKLDFIFAKARYSKEIKGNQPIINTNKQIILEQARHPLIDYKKAVPVSLTLGKDYQMLLITGPNTGGKTVTLKTVGLLTCMACSGLHITAKETSSIGVFKKIFADIGDDQSITASLSTFSAHMKNIVDIVENADDNTLVLVDELGSGTDPVEGQALAISVLDYLKENGVLAIATTHYQELKKYAMVTEGFQNASVEFDVETLTPTYHLLVGIPGKSNAFEISKKLGLKDEIIEKSKKRLHKDEIDFEELMKQLYDDKRKIELEKQEIDTNLEEVKNLKEKLKQNHTELLEAEQEKIQKAKIEARNIILEAKEEANEIIRKMKQIEKGAGSDANKKLNNLRNKLNENIKEQNQELYTKNVNNNIEKEQVKPGISVYVENLGQQGTVISNVSKDEQVLVQIGSMKMNVPIQNLIILKNQKTKKQNSVSQSYTKMNKTKNAKTEINVIGLNVEEARFVVEKFLDDSLLANLQTVRIVHGKGTGKLREGIHQMLKKDPHVKSYRMGAFGEGEMGVTVVELKR